MNLELAVDLFRITILQAMTLVAPLLTTAIVIGLAVSLFQSVTSIQEQTLTFVPKLIAVGLMTIASVNWMLRSLIEFATEMIMRMPNMTG